MLLVAISLVLCVCVCRVGFNNCGRHGPAINFEKPIDSIAVSGHKMLGCPMPCGVLLPAYTATLPSLHKMPFFQSHSASLPQAAILCTRTGRFDEAQTC